MLSKMKNVKGFTLIELMVVVAIIGIILAVAIPYYVGYKRTACDGAAQSDIAKLAASFERFGHELVGFNLKFNEEVGQDIIANNALQYFVGPFYGWGGGTVKCEVMARLTNTGNRSIAQACSIKGSHPRGGTTRYMYQVPVVGGGDLPSEVTAAAECVPGDGSTATAFNQYGTQCYTESFVGGNSGGSMIFRSPGGTACSSITSAM